VTVDLHTPQIEGFFQIPVDTLTAVPVLAQALAAATPPTGAIVSARVHHRHRAEAVLSGLLRVTIDDESVILTDGDIVFVPAGAARRIEPVGSAPVLCIEAVDRSTRA